MYTVVLEGGTNPEKGGREKRKAAYERFSLEMNFLEKLSFFVTISGIKGQIRGFMGLEYLEMKKSSSNWVCRLGTRSACHDW